MKKVQINVQTDGKLLKMEVGNGSKTTQGFLGFHTEVQRQSKQIRLLNTVRNYNNYYMSALMSHNRRNGKNEMTVKWSPTDLSVQVYAYYKCLLAAFCTPGSRKSPTYDLQQETNVFVSWISDVQHMHGFVCLNNYRQRGDVTTWTRRNARLLLNVELNLLHLGHDTTDQRRCPTISSKKRWVGELDDQRSSMALH